jgi:hypothetical protein
MSSQHPFFFAASLLPEDIQREYFNKDTVALKARVLASAQELLDAEDADFHLALSNHHVVCGLHDCLVDGRAVGLLSDIANF